MENNSDIQSCPKISIITPVYKAEKYLHKCVDSIIAQSFQDWELLLIDDGSPDNSGKICDEYAEKDSRIKVFHKENGGVSSARNVGLDNANGDWVMFVDADDWLDEKAFEVCVKNAVDVEFIRFNMISVNKENNYDIDDSVKDNLDYNEYLAKVVGRKTTISVWGGMYSSSLIKKKNIRFDTKYSLGEDWLFLYLLLKNTTKIKTISAPLYYYSVMNNESVVHTLDITKAYQLIEVASCICFDKYVQNRKMHREIVDCKCDVCTTCLAGLLLKKTNIRIYKSLLVSLIQHKMYPSLKAIFKSILPSKFKLMLFFFYFVVVGIKLCSIK